MIPLISVCIPVYNTEPYLALCLRSVMLQDFTDFEVVVLSDASRGKDEKGRSAKKLVHLAQKINKRIPIRFVEHKENHGILETRRTLCMEAKGSYICFVDSDDELEEGALCALNFSNDGPDIIQGKSVSGAFDENGAFIPSANNRYGQITIGGINDHQIFHEWVSDGKISGVLWSKLIRRELLLRAFENIPYSECNFAEDYLISFFITQFAKSYRGIDCKFYRYRISSGVSSSRRIDNLKKWEMICSTASVFTIISDWLNNHDSESQISIEEIDAIKRKTSYYLANNLQQLKETVIPELQAQAYKMLCEYWGEHFVAAVEESLKK